MLVTARPESLRRCFDALIGLQPVRWTDGGLVCSPRAAPELARTALKRCPLPTVHLDELPGLPEPEADVVAGWYRRGPQHAGGPNPERELIQVAGDGFGLGGHATTAMCLAALPHLPAEDAVDVGCGSGLLSQAWVRRTGRSVLACDADPTATRHARRSIAAAGLDDRIDVVTALVQSLPAASIAGRVLLANLPAAGHTALQEVLAETPPGVIASGIHGAEAEQVIAGYRKRGLRPVRSARRGRWQCWTLVAT